MEMAEKSEKAEKESDGQTYSFWEESDNRPGALQSYFQIVVVVFWWDIQDIQTDCFWEESHNRPEKAV